MNEKEIEIINYAKNLINLYETDMPLTFGNDEKELISALIDIIENRNRCLCCGDDYTSYCEDCYQKLIAKNAELQLKGNNTSDFTIIENSRKAQDEYGHCYGSNTYTISKDDIAALLYGKQLAIDDRRIYNIYIIRRK